MSIAARFQAALTGVSEPAVSGPEMLPARLIRAAARMLPVDDAGLSVVVPGGECIPLAASSELASLAERLQFTVGGGPCMAAHATGEPVFAMLQDLRRRWAPMADQLLTRTPFRAVVALPLPKGVAGQGAVDFYFREEKAVSGLDVFEAMAVGDLITTALSEAAVLSTWTPDRGPEWLHGPVATGRAAVWEAMGKLALELDLEPQTALDLMRAAAWSGDRTVDEVAAELLSGRLTAEDLRGPGRSGTWPR